MTYEWWPWAVNFTLKLSETSPGQLVALITNGTISANL